jgi:MSHA biogenesis protein MshG
MANFSYKGRDAGGAMVEGTLEGTSADAIANTLFGRGVTPLEIQERKAAAGAAGSLDFKQFFKDKIQHEDVTLFTRQLNTLLKAGVPIMRALAGLQESGHNRSMKTVIGNVRSSLDSGRELAVAFSEHPKVFSPFYLSMVRVGEMTGMLEDILLRLFHHLEFQHFMRNQVKAAIRYPTFVIIAMAIAIMVVNLMVIPAFAKVFEGFGAELPLMTRMLLGFSNFMVAYWPHIIVAVIGAIFGFRAWTNSTKGKYDWDRIKMKIPIAGKIVEKATLARFAASFALASRSGVPVVQAMTVVAQTVDNDYISKKVEGMRDTIERGESILRAAIQANVFTPVVLQMIAVGEESGSIDEMMQEVSEMYQREVEYELKTLSAQIEPILIVFLGVLVLILALGIFLPIWDLGKVSMGRK